MCKFGRTSQAVDWIRSLRGASTLGASHPQDVIGIPFFESFQGTVDNFFWPGRLHQVGAARSTILRPTWAQSSGCQRLV